jgi:hypothetical protein
MGNTTRSVSVMETTTKPVLPDHELVMLASWIICVERSEKLLPNACNHFRKLVGDAREWDNTKVIEVCRLIDKNK